MKLKNRFYLRILVLLIMPTLGGCGIYSFTGANIAPTIETISIDRFYDDAGEGPASLSQNFTDQLRDYFLQNTNLALVPSNGDLQFEGSIVGYRLSPVAPTAVGNDNMPDEAGLMRLTITVKAVYLNTQDDTFNFDKNFSFYDDYNPRSTSLSAVEDQLIETIFEQIVYDIFNASVANW